MRKQCQLNRAFTPEPVRAANLRWLAGYRRPYVPVGSIAETLLAAASCPRPLIGLAESVGDPVAVLPTLFHLLWAGALHGDLSRPLRDDALVGSADGLNRHRLFDWAITSTTTGNLGSWSRSAGCG